MCDIDFEACICVSDLDVHADLVAAIYAATCKLRFLLFVGAPEVGDSLLKFSTLIHFAL